MSRKERIEKTLAQFEKAVGKREKTKEEARKLQKEE